MNAAERLDGALRGVLKGYFWLSSIGSTFSGLA